MYYILPELNHKQNQKYFIYGTGDVAKQYYMQLVSAYGNDSVVCFVESNPLKDEFLGKEVVKPKEIKLCTGNSYKFIVTSFSSANIMIDNLIEIGISSNDIIKTSKSLNQLYLKNDTPKIESLCFYPEVNDEKNFRDLLDRIKWYLPKTQFCNLKTILISDLHNMNEPESVEIHDSKYTEDILLNSDIILLWNKEFIDADILDKYRSKIYCVDPTFYSTVESAFYRTLYYYCLESNMKEHFKLLSRANYKSMIERNKFKEKAYVFGTGPSLEQATDFSYDNGFNIICNSTVKNQSLMDYIKPNLLVFADPVFHFSPCEYSAKFREDAISAIQKYDLYFMIPDYTVPLILAHYPEVKDKIIGIPMLSNEFNFPSEEKYFVKATANILTLFMLPVASFVSEKIYIIGCDGREKNETYFWKHNDSAQYNGLMKTVFDMHPSFFRDRVYQDYYDEHCEILKNLIEFGETKGKKYYSLTKSHIPVLSERSCK